MNRCVRFGGSTAGKQLTAAKRLYSASSSLSNGPENEHPTPTPTEQSSEVATPEDINPPAQRDGFPKPYLRRPLPISPLMDPTFLAARQRHSKPKSPPSKTPTLFQQQLAKNPYALALATPLRMCSMTKVALPRYFLQDFNPIAHPETGVPWYLPRSLTSPRTVAGREENPQESKGEEMGVGDELKEDSGTATIGPKVYTLARKELLRQMKTGSPHKRFPSERLRKYKESNEVIGKAQWRQDMDDFILELMRRRVVESLVHLGGLKRGYLVGCDSWEDAMAKPQVGVLLWTGGIGEQNVDEPPEFATLFKTKERQRKVPVHNLQRLLGQKKLEELKSKFSNGLFGRELLAVKHKNATIALQLKLWKLQGYLAEYREELGVEEQMEDINEEEQSAR